MTRSIPSPDAGEPTRLVGGLERVVRALGGPGLDAVAGVAGAWERVAGDDLVAHTRQVALHDGSLVVTVDDAACAAVIRWQGGELADRVSALLATPVRDVVVRVRAGSGDTP